jgi:hypothetical protein
MLVAIYARHFLYRAGSKVPDMEVTPPGAQKYARIGGRGVESGHCKRRVLDVQRSENRIRVRRARLDVMKAECRAWAGGQQERICGMKR